MRLIYIVVVGSLIPQLASAQPSVDPAPAEPPGSGLPPPAPPPNAGPPAMMPLPLYSMTDPGLEFHHGITFEANLGAFGAHIGGDQFGGSSANYAGVGGLDVGLGGWLGRRVALTVRIAGGDFKSYGNTMVAGFIGPSAQLWLDPHLWLGAGIGLALLGQVNCSGVACSSGGLGLDVRAGYSFGGTAHTVNISVEATPAFYSAPTDYMAAPSSSAGFAVLFGYQYL